MIDNATSNQLTSVLTGFESRMRLEEHDDKMIVPCFEGHKCIDYLLGISSYSSHLVFES